MADAEKKIDEATLRSALAANLKSLLESRGLTQNKLAKQLGVSAATIGSIYHATKTPSIWLVARIASALRVSVDELVGLKKRGRRPRKVA